MKAFFSQLRTCVSRFAVGAEKILLVIGVLSCVVLASAGCVSRRNLHSTVVTPNPNALGRKIATANELLIGRSAHGSKFPVEVRLVIQDGVIDEIQAFYAENVQIDTIAETINLTYGNNEIAALHADRYRMWGVPAKHFEIRLYEFRGEKLVSDERDYGPVLHEREKAIFYYRVHKRRKTS